MTEDGPRGTPDLVHLARRYYLDDVSKVELARESGLSRFQVARLLAEARERGLVHITVGEPDEDDARLADEIAVRFGLARAVVAPGDGGSAIEAVGGAAGELLADLIPEGSALGLAWSRAVEAMARRVPRLPPCTVVQLAGAIHVPGDRLGSVEVTRLVAEASGGIAHPIYAPLVVGDARTAASLAAEPAIAETLRLAREVDVALVSVGAWRPSGSMLHGMLAEADVVAARDAGAVAELSGRLLGADGASIVTGLDDRVVGIRLDELAAVPTVVATAHGAYRHEATRAALKAGFVDALVVDRPLALALLAE